jgi:hypothetical protein
MQTEPRLSRASMSSSATSRIASRQELTSFYRAIGISAVASAMQAAKMMPAAPATKNDLPAFLRDAHTVG